MRDWIYRNMNPIYLLSGIFKPLLIASLTGRGSCCIVLVAWPRTPFSCSGTVSSIMVGISKVPSTYSSFIRNGPSTDNLVNKLNLLSNCVQIEKNTTKSYFHHHSPCSTRGMQHTSIKQRKEMIKVHRIWLRSTRQRMKTLVIQRIWLGSRYI